MKKVTYLISFLLISTFTLFAQDHKNGVGVHFTGIDFYGPQTGNYFTNDKLNDASGKNDKKFFYDPAVRVTYWHAFNSHFDLNAGIGVAALQYPNSNKDSSFIKTKLYNSAFKNQQPYVALDAKLNYNILPKFNYLISPYLTAGLSGSLRGADKGIDIPAGLGFNIHLGHGVFINLESNYRVALSAINQNHLTHSAGLVYWWKTNKKEKPAPVVAMPAPPVIKDTDNDGIADNDDSCPTLPGTKQMKGCPDKDNDGIADNEDLCPEQKGVKQFNGCPDSDGDGIQDNKDACPTVAGTSKYKGCPIPDADNDGFNDEVDKCPQVASSVNNGCPEIKQEDKKKIEMAAQGINFETGSANIKKASLANLDKIVDILKSEPTYLVDIEGHTDNVGTSEKNLELSQKRADACKKYLVDHGIQESRINSTGFGDMKPIGDNKTSQGRALNRRTEFNIRNY
ncbi:MAG TPA: OmpA family protein [Chitinophagaceae bacterium]|nr:OmpA family protein [Chitinophagaceae bacterium]